MPTGQTKPTSCWFWCVAESGERKTATDDQAFAPQKQHERQLRIRHKVEIETYDVRKKMWEAQKKAIEKQFKDPGAAGSEAHQKELEKLGPEPEKPLDPLIMSSEFTFEGMVRCLNLGQPLYGIIGSEGGQFIGGHGMTEESKLRTITGLSAAWDGEPIKRVRATETVILCGRRVGMHLMVQPEVAATALTDELLTKQGFMSRILACAPEGLIGKRMHKSPPPEAEQVLQKYKDRILSILETPYPLAPDTRNELEPRDVPSPRKPNALFWEFADEVEKADGPRRRIRIDPALRREAPGARCAPGRGYCRLSGPQLHRTQPRRFLLRGIRIATYYATEAKRISGASRPAPNFCRCRSFCPHRSCSIGSCSTGTSPPSARGISIAAAPTPSGIGRAPSTWPKFWSSTAGSSPSKRAGTTCGSGKSSRDPTNEHARFHHAGLEYRPGRDGDHPAYRGWRPHPTRIVVETPRSSPPTQMRSAASPKRRHSTGISRAAAPPVLGSGKQGVGARAYAEHPSTEMLCVSFARGNGPVETWVPGQPIPEVVLGGRC